MSKKYHCNHCDREVDNIIDNDYVGRNCNDCWIKRIKEEDSKRKLISEPVYAYIERTEAGDETCIYKSKEKAEAKMKREKIEYVKWSYEEHYNSDYKELDLDEEPKFKEDYELLLEIMRTDNQIIFEIIPTFLYK